MKEETKYNVKKNIHVWKYRCGWVLVKVYSSFLFISFTLAIIVALRNTESSFFLDTVCWTILIDNFTFCDRFICNISLMIIGNKQFVGSSYQIIFILCEIDFHMSFIAPTRSSTCCKFVFSSDGKAHIDRPIIGSLIASLYGLWYMPELRAWFIMNWMNDKLAFSPLCAIAFHSSN